MEHALFADAGGNGAEVAGAEGQVEAKLGKGELQALRSYFYKACRVGLAEEAMLAAEHLWRAGNEWYVLKTCLGLLGEDGDPDCYARIAPGIMGALQMSKGVPRHTFWHIVYLTATSKKWYMTERGQELEACRHLVKEKDLPPITFPPWVFDRHTAEGWRRISAGTADLRLDGGWENRWAVRDLWHWVTMDASSHAEKLALWHDYWRVSVAGVHAKVDGEGV